MLTTIETELTRQAWQQWKNHNTKPRLTWLELHKLAEHVTGKLREYGRDYSEIDFQALLDPQLNYYENLDEIDVSLHMRGYSLDGGFEGLGAGTTRLKLNLHSLRVRNKKQHTRIMRQKKQIAKLKAKIKKPRGRRKRKCNAQDVKNGY